MLCSKYRSLWFTRSLCKSFFSLPCELALALKAVGPCQKLGFQFFFCETGGKVCSVLPLTFQILLLLVCVGNHRTCASICAYICTFMDIKFMMMMMMMMMMMTISWLATQLLFDKFLWCWLCNIYSILLFCCLNINLSVFGLVSLYFHVS